MRYGRSFVIASNASATAKIRAAPGARLARKAGVERRVHAHGLRHAFAVDLVRSGAPLYVVRDALGHSSVATTQVYLSRVGADETVEAMRSREWRLGA